MNDLQAVEYLLKKDFDVNTLINGSNAVSLAWERKYEEIVYCLLKSNSMFPINFDDSKVTNENLKDFCKILLKFEEFVKDGKIEEVKEIFEFHDNLRFFYNFNNESAITTCLHNKQFELYEFFASNNLQFGPFENIDSILNILSKNERKKLRSIHLQNSKELTDKHIISLMSNSFVGHDNLDERKKFKYVMRAYHIINRIKVISLILQIVAASRNFKIIFDFKRENVRYMDPTSQPGANGLFYLSGRIYIAAKQLLDHNTENIVFGVLAHELCHYAMHLVYNNMAKPFSQKNVEAEQEYAEVLNECEQNQEKEEIVELVFTHYDENIQSQELIVRVPQILATFHKNEEIIEEARNNFPRLFKYVNTQVIPDMERRLPEIKNQMQKEIQDLAKKNVKRQNKILKITLIILLISFFCGIPVLVKLLEPQLYSWLALSDSQRNFIRSSYVNFQGENVRFSDIASDASLEVLSSNQIHHLISNKTHKMKIHHLVEKFKFKVIKRYFSDQNSTKKLDADDLENIIEKNKIMLISGIPGSGRSVELKINAINIKKKFKSKWISYLPLKSHMSHVKSCFNIDTEKDVIDFIQKLLNLNLMEASIFQESFHKNHVVLLIDEMEEIGILNRTLIINLVKGIVKYSENQIWMSARPVISEILEKSFQIPSYNLLPFSHENVLNFIDNFLDNNLSELKRNVTKHFVIDRIESLKVKGRDVTNPMMIKMITKDSIENGNMSNLYTMFNTHVKYMQNKTQVGDDILHAHEFFAINILLNFSFKDIFTLKHKFIYSKVNQTLIETHMVDKLGILYFESESYRFIHDAFAEYFLSRFFIRNLKNTNSTQAQNALELLFPVIFKFPSIYEYIIGYIEYIEKQNKLIISSVVEDLMIEKFKNIFKFIISSDEIDEKLEKLDFISKMFSKNSKVLNAIWFCDENETIFNWMSKDENITSSEISQIENIAKKYLSNFEEVKNGKFQKGNNLYKSWINSNNSMNFTEFYDSVKSALSDEEKSELFVRHPIQIFGDVNLSYEEFLKYWNLMNHTKAVLHAIDFRTYQNILHRIIKNDPRITETILSSIKKLMNENEARNLLSQQDKINNETSFMIAARGDSEEVISSLWDLISKYLNEEEFLLLKNNRNFTSLEIAATSKSPNVYSKIFDLYKNYFNNNYLQKLLHNNYFLFYVVDQASYETCELVALSIRDIFEGKVSEIDKLFNLRFNGDSIFSKYNGVKNLKPFNDILVKNYNSRKLNLESMFKHIYIKENF